MLPSDPPTDRPDLVDQQVVEPSEHYLSVRVTVGHNNDKPISERLLGDVPHWMFYRHGAGASGARREHYHVCIPIRGSDAGRESDKFRKRIKTIFGVSGPGSIGIVHKDNGLHSFIFYCSHEKDATPVMRGDWSRIFEKNREVNGERTFEKSRKRHFDGDIEDNAETRKKRCWQLTYSNLVTQAVLHTKRTKTEFGNLKFAVKNMIETTNWRPSPEMIRKGVPAFYENDYARQMDGKVSTDMSWWDSH